MHSVQRAALCVLLTIVAAVSSVGCQRTSDTPPVTPLTLDPYVDAGPVGEYGREGIYDTLRPQGIILVRRGNYLSALSARCGNAPADMVRIQPDGTLLCEQTKTVYDIFGRSMRGPGKNLDHYYLSVNPRGRVVVDRNRQVLTDEYGSPGAWVNVAASGG